MKLNLKARVKRSDARTIRHALEQLCARGAVKAGDELVVEAEMEGASARELNRRMFLSALKKGEARRRSGCLPA